MAKIFHDIGFIEGWGTGFLRMVEACTANGNPKPELKEITGAFVVKFARRLAGEGKGGGISGGVNGGITEDINRLANYVWNTPGKNVAEITAALDIPQRTVERWLKKLKEQGKIAFIGSRKTGGYHAT